MLGGIIKYVETASGVSNTLAFSMMFLEEGFWPIKIMPSYVQTIAKILSLYYFNEGLRQALILNNYQAVLLPFINIGFLTAVFVALAKSGKNLKNKLDFKFENGK